MSNILLYGGTFDPPHLGHIQVPKEALDFLSFDTVLYIPAFHAPLKGAPTSADRHRIEMLRLALSDCDWAEISTVEIDRGGISFSIDTIEALQNDQDTFRVLIGADQWKQFEQWHRWEEIVRLANPAIMPRNGFSPQGDRLLPITPLSCTSTKIREQIRSGIDWKAHLHPEVVNYITKHRLYL